MVRVNRAEVVAEDEVQVFHLVNRCVRRTLLCGVDERTGRDFSHRKQWIRDRLEELAGIFGIEVLAYCVMSNHLHVVVRTRPDVVKEWSNDEIAERWWALFPQRKKRDGTGYPATEQEIQVMAGNRLEIAERRKRLVSISWFMRCLAEVVARRANKEEQTTGRFWDGRYKAQPLPDETAISACVAYVDLNPVRAGVADTPEASEFTSVQDRVADRESAKEVRTKSAKDDRVEHGRKAGWLAPVSLVPKRKRVREKKTGRRASNRGFLPMSLDQYLLLLDWAGQEIAYDRNSRDGTVKKKRRMRRGLRPILERLDSGGDVWLDLVKNFRKRFGQYTGTRAEEAPTVSATVGTVV